jgi:glycosyltransferase involved in cell wall biosynthesis
VAAESGVRVVVTMHDWWWFCARQFLLDKHGERCSPVVDAGACECDLTRAWLAGRRAWLDEQVRHADLVLAPSSITADSFAANGIERSRLRVDENGIPPPPDEIRSVNDSVQRDRSGVRFLYVGKSSYVKGVDVLFRAAQLLASVPGWSLDMYGAEKYIEREGHDLSSLPVRLPPPYTPEEVGSVLAGADVMLVPSTMAESHSIVTREALQHGLPVITSNCWGPEEAVEHGRNGLIVPIGDPEALASAMRTLVNDRTLLHKLKDNCGDVTIRSLDEQVEGLLAMYHQLLSTSGVNAADHPSDADDFATVENDRVSRRMAFLADTALRIPRIAGPTRIGIHAAEEKEWSVIASTLQALPAGKGEIELFAFGPTSIPAPLRAHVKQVPEQPWHSLPALLRQMDILLIPRSADSSDAPRTWMHAALVARPVIASAREPFVRSIEHEANGLLAAGDDDWRAGLHRLIADGAERRRLGERARRDLLFSPWLQGITEGRAGRGDEFATLKAIAERPQIQTPTIRLGRGEGISFPLPTTAAGLMQIDLMAATFGGPGIPLRLTLFDPDDPGVMQSAVVRSFQVGDRAWTSFHFTLDREIAQPWLRLQREEESMDDPFVAVAKPNAPVALWAERRGAHYIAGRAIGGAPCIRVWGDPAVVQRRSEPAAGLSQLAKLGARLRFADYLLRTEGASSLKKRVVGFFTQRN